MKNDLLNKLGSQLITHEFGLREDLMSYEKGKYVYAMFKNGVYKIYRQDSVVNFDLVAPVKEGKKIPMLPTLDKNYEYILPKIPFQIYINILDFFKTVYAKDKTEASVMVYYNLYEEDEIEIPTHLQARAEKGLDIMGKWYVYAPVQRNSSALTDFKNDELDEYLRTKCCKVIETHSHHTMGAFWSATDNANQKENMFYGVFGKINTEDKFLLKLVANDGVVYDKLDVSDLFEFPQVKVDTKIQIENSSTYGDIFEASVEEEEVIYENYKGVFKQLNQFKPSWLEQHSVQRYVAPVKQYGTSFKNSGVHGHSNGSRWYDKPMNKPTPRRYLLDDDSMQDNGDWHTDGQGQELDDMDLEQVIMELDSLSTTATTVTIGEHLQESTKPKDMKTYADITKDFTDK